MENAIIALKKELIDWIDSLDNFENLQKIADLKDGGKSSSLISDINSETILKDDFDEQFAAGMTSDELMENIAAHIKSIDSEDH